MDYSYVKILNINSFFFKFKYDFEILYIILKLIIWQFYLYIVEFILDNL